MSRDKCPYCSGTGYVQGPWKIKIDPEEESERIATEMVRLTIAKVRKDLGLDDSEQPQDAESER